MRKLAYEYWLNNGTMIGIAYSDVGTDCPCSPTTYYQYWLLGSDATRVWLASARCTSGGKTPNASRKYTFYLVYFPGTDQDVWHCCDLDYPSAVPCPGFSYPP